MSDLSIIKGETFSHVYTIVNNDNVVVNLTGFTLTAFAQPQTQILNEKTQIPITVAALVLASGTVTVTITAAISSTFSTNNPITILIKAVNGTVTQQLLTDPILILPSLPNGSW